MNEANQIVRMPSIWMIERADDLDPVRGVGLWPLVQTWRWIQSGRFTHHKANIVTNLGLQLVDQSEAYSFIIDCLNVQFSLA